MKKQESKEKTSKFHLYNGCDRPLISLLLAVSSNDKELRYL